MWVGLIAIGALVFRLQHLELRPFHPDEGVQAVKAGQLYDTGHYRYDPSEFHGPSLYYLSMPLLKLGGARTFAGTSDADFRRLPVLCGAGLILLLLVMRRDLGSVATLTAAALLAVSPAMVFYSRYYIQEMPLVMFASLALTALWRFDRTRRLRWAFLLGAALGLMYATKETSILYGGAMMAAYGWLVLRRRISAGRPVWSVSRPSRLALMLVAGSAAVVAGVFFSSFLEHPRGLLDSLLAFRQYIDRSGGDGSAAIHRQPWYYYLMLLGYTKIAPGPWWSEGLILGLAVIGLIATLRGRLPAAIHPELAVLVAVYTLCLTGMYALIPYKTPWNLLGFLHGLILLAGIGASAVFHRLPRWPWRAGWLLVLLGSTTQLAAQALRANSRFCADPRNPYVYAHSVPDVVRLARRIDEMAALHPDGRSLRVHFITPDYWPLPYYLRNFDHIGYWSEIPAVPDAPLLVVGAELQERLEPLLHDSYHTVFYGLRPDVLLVLYVRQDLWARYLETKSGPSETIRAVPK